MPKQQQSRKLHKDQGQCQRHKVIDLSVIVKGVNMLHMVWLINGVLLCKIYTILKYSYYKYFPISRNFYTKLDYFAQSLQILSLFSLAS